jgi:Fe-S-cluster containining protein
MTREVSFDHRDPGLRPFIEVEAKIARDTIAEGRVNGASAKDIVAAIAETAENDAESGARELSERLPTRHLPIACAPGCASCCYTNVHASTAEVLRIASFVKEKLGSEELATLRARAERTAKVIEPLDIVDRAKAKVACPLLDEASGACTVYEVRPIACRAYHSGDAALCKRALDEADPNPVLPINPVLFHVPHAHGFGMLTGCVDAGLDVGPYDLAAALPIALAEELDARWLAGEKVFEHTSLTRELLPGYEEVLTELVTDLREGRLDMAEKIGKKLDPDARRRERNKKKRERRGR